MCVRLCELNDCVVSRAPIHMCPHPHDVRGPEDVSVSRAFSYILKEKRKTLIYSNDPIYVYQGKTLKHDMNNCELN